MKTPLFSPQQARVVEMIEQSMTITQIARALDISRASVYLHLKRIKVKRGEHPQCERRYRNIMYHVCRFYNRRWIERIEDGFELEACCPWNAKAEAWLAFFNRKIAKPKLFRAKK
jgi:AcrR family transcriptional regulator